MGVAALPRVDKFVVATAGKETYGTGMTAVPMMPIQTSSMVEHTMASISDAQTMAAQRFNLNSKVEMAQIRAKTMQQRSAAAPSYKQAKDSVVS